MFQTLRLFSFNFDIYSIFYSCAIVTAAFLIRRELNRHHFPPLLFIEILLVGTFAGFIGSKLYFCVSGWNEVMRDPAGFFFSIHGSGWFGGLFLGGLSVLLFLRLNKYSVLAVLDAVIPAVPLAQAIGRLGCFLSGDGCYGVPSDMPWAMAFPDGLVPTYDKVHPTPLYELITCALVFALLWKLRRKEMPAGFKLSIYLAISGAGRFVVEFYRCNREIFLGLTLPQVASILSILSGFFIILNGRIAKRNFKISYSH